MCTNLEDMVEIISTLGKGGQGKVYLARVRNIPGVQSNIKIAVKLVKFKNYEDLKIYKREVDILKRLSSFQQKCHSSIICFYDSMLVYYKGTTVFAIFMEFFTGIELEKFIDMTRDESIKYDILKSLEKRESNKFLPINDLHHIFYELLSGLVYMHSKDVVHRDIKPENILYNPDTNSLKYIDFGFSCDLSFDQDNESYIKCGNDKLYVREANCTMKLIGTFEFMSPELAQLRGMSHRSVDIDQDLEMLKKIDVWALGILFFELLFGYTPTYTLLERHSTRRTMELYFKDIQNFTMDESKVPKYDHILKRYVNLTLMMLNSNYIDRPSAEECLQYLKKKNL